MRALWCALAVCGGGLPNQQEAGNINTSLMTLGKCLDCMKWNQSHKKGSKRLIPFRDSKLTRLFKNYFEGKGSVRMIVNISQVLSSFDETAHVLRFSAMARQVSTTAVTSKINTGLNKIKGELAMSLTSDIMDLEDYNSSLHEKLAELQQQLIDVEMRSSKMEEAIREEVAEEMAEQMLALEQGYQNAATQQTAATEQKFEKKWGVYTHSVARLPVSIFSLPRPCVMPLTPPSPLPPHPLTPYLYPCSLLARRACRIAPCWKRKDLVSRIFCKFLPFPPNRKF